MELYNVDRKLQYINSIANENTQLSTDYFLRSCSEVEEMFGKDLCDFSYMEYVILFERKKFISTATFTTNKSHIKGYVEWCISNNFITSDRLVEVERLQIEDLNSSFKIKTEMFKDEDDLINCINAVVDGDQTWKDMYLAFYGLCWYGLSDEDLFTLEANAVSGNQVNAASGLVTVSDKFAKILERYKDTTVVAVGNIGNEKEYEYISSPLFIKVLKIARATYEIDRNFHSTRHKAWVKLMAEVPVASEYYGKELIPQKIRNSGLYWRILQIEKSGKEVSVSNILDYVPNNAKDNQARFRKASVVFRDYTHWKKDLHEE